MRKQLFQHGTRDMTLLGGWLFADLLLGLMVVFLAATPPVLKPSVPPPTLTVSPQELSPQSPACTGGLTQPSCTVTVGETASSQGSLHWMASSDMSDSVLFSAAQTTLAPGQSTKVTISAFPCQNGSFTFAAAGGVVPVTVRWRCTPPTQRLEQSYQTFHLQINDVQGLLNNSDAEVNDIENQVRQQRILQGRSVGLTIAYGGAPTDADIPQAQSIADHIYEILQQVGASGFAFQRSSYYTSLYNLGTSVNDVQVDVYFFVQS